MKRTDLDKRQFSRIEAILPIYISPEFLGETVDLSETGISFILKKPLLLSKAQAKIKFASGENVDTEFKVIWSKYLVKDGKFTYGACFIRFKEKDLEIIRSILIKSSLNSLLQKVIDKKNQDLISAFWNDDLREYINKLAKMTKLLEQGEDKEPIYKEVVSSSDAIMQRGDELENRLNDKMLIKKVKKAFREICGPWVYQSEIVKRAFEKPRGYPGDYKIIEIIYDNKPISQNFGFCADRYFLNNAYAVAIRNRKDKMREILFSYLNNTNSPKVSILNIACGSNRELKEIFVDQKFSPKRDIMLTLVDQDEEALKFSEQALGGSAKKLACRFMQHNVLEYINQSTKYSEILGMQDLIYSIGLADYLPDRVLKNLIIFCFNLLKPEGQLIIAHKDAAKYKPLSPDWWCDWTFYPRDENSLMKLIHETQINNLDIKIEREPSKIICFLTIKKK